MPTKKYLYPEELKWRVDMGCWQCHKQVKTSPFDIRLWGEGWLCDGCIKLFAGSELTPLAVVVKQHA